MLMLLKVRKELKYIAIWWGKPSMPTILLFCKDPFTLLCVL